MNIIWENNLVFVLVVYATSAVLMSILLTAVFRKSKRVAHAPTYLVVLSLFWPLMFVGAFAHLVGECIRMVLVDFPAWVLDKLYKENNN
jgi:hypothetical protein